MYDDILVAKFSKYIEIVVKNTSINYFRKKIRIREQEVNINEIEIVSSSRKDADAIFSVETKVLYNSLENIFSEKKYYNAMKNLTEKEKMILCFRLLEEKPFEEIAKILNINENSVRIILCRAKKKFKNNLKE
jgi:RNA polymerase sigma factor (sigma-70 family)